MKTTVNELLESYTEKYGYEMTVAAAKESIKAYTRKAIEGRNLNGCLDAQTQSFVKFFEN